MAKYVPTSKWITSAISRFAIIEEIGSAQHVLKGRGRVKNQG
jgi:hypothetical protein